MVKIINGEIVADDDPRLQQRHQAQPPGPRARGAEAPEGARRPPAAAAAGGAGAGGGAGGGGGIGFDLHAPPLRFVPPPPGVEPLFGVPDAEVFGVRLSPYAVLSAVTLGMFYGWRGIVMVLVLYYVYLASQNNNTAQAAQPGAAGASASRQAGAAAGGQQQQQPRQQQPGNMATDFLQRYMNGPQPRSRAGQGSGAGVGPGQAGPGSRAEPPGAARQEGAGGPGGAGGGDDGGWAAFKGQGNKLGGK